MASNDGDEDLRNCAPSTLLSMAPTGPDQNNVQTSGTKSNIQQIGEPPDFHLQMPMSKEFRSPAGNHFLQIPK